jgi:hypothetical protein
MQAWELKFLGPGLVALGGRPSRLGAEPGLNTEMYENVNTEMHL